MIYHNIVVLDRKGKIKRKEQRLCLLSGETKNKLIYTWTKTFKLLRYKECKKYRKIRKYRKAKQRLWLLSGETTLPRLSLLLTITSTRVVRQSSN